MIQETKLKVMSTPGRKKDEDLEKKEPFPEKEKDWENPKNPEAPEDQRDAEQLQRQIEEAKRRKENLTED